MYVKRLQKKWDQKSPEEQAEIEEKTARRYEANMARVAHRRRAPSRCRSRVFLAHTSRY
jgi:hypothetical protein